MFKSFPRGEVDEVKQYRITQEEFENELKRCLQSSYKELKEQTEKIEQIDEME